MYFAAFCRWRNETCFSFVYTVECFRAKFSSFVQGFLVVESKFPFLLPFITTFQRGQGEQTTKGFLMALATFMRSFSLSWLRLGLSVARLYQFPHLSVFLVSGNGH